MMTSYCSSHFSPKCHLAGMPRLAWDASTGPHLIPDRVCGFEVTDWWYPKVLHMFSKEPRVFPCTRACKDPTLALTISQLSMHESSKAALQGRMPGTVVFMVFSGATLRGTLAFILQAVCVEPTQTLCQFKGLPAVSPFLLSPHESLVFPERINLQPHYRLLFPLQALSPGSSLPVINVKCKKEPQESLLNTSSYESIKKLCEISVSFSTWEGRGN